MFFDPPRSPAGAIALVSADDPAVTPIDDLLLRIGQHVQQLQEQWAVVIGDETYVQNVRERGRHVISRTLRSEMLFMWLSQQDVWLSIRNVQVVDGRAIPDSSGRLDRALAAPGFDYVSQLGQLKAESARFDVGQVWRTTGNPTVVLRFLLPGNQTHFTFTRKGEERIGGQPFTKLAFAEHDRPTAIDFNGGDVLSTGGSSPHRLCWPSRSPSISSATRGSNCGCRRGWRNVTTTTVRPRPARRDIRIFADSKRRGG